MSSCTALSGSRGSAPLVVLLAHEALEGREATVEDELEVAQLALRQAEVDELLRLGDELLLDRRIAHVEVLEDTAVGRVGLPAGTRLR